VGTIFHFASLIEKEEVGTPVRPAEIGETINYSLPTFGPLSESLPAKAEV